MESMLVVIKSVVLLVATQMMIPKTNKIIIVSIPAFQVNY